MKKPLPRLGIDFRFDQPLLTHARGSTPTATPTGKNIAGIAIEKLRFAVLHEVRRKDQVAVELLASQTRVELSSYPCLHRDQFDGYLFQHKRASEHRRR